MESKPHLEMEKVVKEKSHEYLDAGQGRVLVGLDHQVICFQVYESQDHILPPPSS